MATFQGTGRADALTGTSADDVMRGGGGNDRMAGNAGNDVMAGSIGRSSAADLANVVIVEDTTATITFNGETAGYQNALGYYKIAADGTITNVKVAFANASLADSGGALVSGTSSVTMDLEAGERVGFFVAPNAYAQPDMAALLADPNATWKMLDRGSNLPGNIGWGATKLVHVAADGTETEIRTAYGTDVFHSASDGSGWLNPDQTQHANGSVDVVNGTVQIGFEDLWQGGDGDYDDSVFTVDLGSVNAMALATAPATAATAQDDDVMAGGDGNDRMFGLGGNDTMDGGTDNDLMFGGSGDDRMTGGAGNDRIFGNSGNDHILADAGNDEIVGGSGFDTLDFSVNATGVTVDLNGHTARGAGTDSVWGIEAVRGSDFADNLTGDKRGNALDGGAGNDVMRGRGGADVLTGGDGNDRFVWHTKDLADGTADRITDFAIGDTVDLHFMFKGLAGDHADLVRVEDTVDGLRISARVGDAFVDVVTLDGMHGTTAADLLASGALLV